MISIVWNPRRLRGPRAFQNLMRLVLEATPDILLICESKINHITTLLLKGKLNFMTCFNVNLVGCKGGLILFWNSNVNAGVLSYSQGHIDVLINHDPHPFYFTGFYGNPNMLARHISWDS